MVNKYKPKLTNLQKGILNFLFENPAKEFNIIRLASYLDVSQPAIKKAISLLQEKEFIKIKKDKVSKRYSIRLNRENSKIFELKRVENLKQIYETGLSYFLFNEFPGATIILFGSYSYGEDTGDSDIDIAIIGTNEKEINLSEYEKKLNREIILNFYKSLKEIKDTHLKNNILNGIVLSGGIGL